MSERKKGLPKPDGPGRWIVVRDDTPTQAVIYFEFADLGGGRLHDTQTNGSAEMWTRDGDQWHRCYVPGLDGEKEPQFPGSPVYRSAIAKLDAAGCDEGLLCGLDVVIRQRDEARQEVERLNESLAAIRRDRDFLGKRLKSVDSERSTIHDAYNDAQAELASLRSQGKGEGDAALIHALDESTKDLVVTVGNITAEIRCSKDPNTAWRWEGVVDHLLDQIDANRRALEASRAT